MHRRDFLKLAGAGSIALWTSRLAPRSPQLPNVILCMADDLGWGDTGYGGHPTLQTPNLDRMAGEGIRFDRFYAGAPVCSPTRGSCLTGRNPQRYGIFGSNAGHMRSEEVTIAEAVKPLGYATGHFGKWHLGTLTTSVEDGNRGGSDGQAHYSPPWHNGFDVCFSTESKVPTWDPMKRPQRGSALGWPALEPGEPFRAYGTHYWTGPGQIASSNLEGDDSRVIMDRVVPFIRDAVREGQPFLAVVWFHSPHLPVVAGPQYAELYRDEELYARNYHGCVTAMDEQIGRLRAELARLGVAGNTMLWFCSDNGPDGGDWAPGRTNGLRGRKHSLHEGGIRVPGLLVWPDRSPRPRRVDTPCVTSDYFPTVLDALGSALPEAGARPYDGISLMPLLSGGMASGRPRPMAFESFRQIALVDNRYKLYSQDGGTTFELYDLIRDPAETEDLAASQPWIVATMRRTLIEWRSSCEASVAGADYNAETADPMSGARGIPEYIENDR